jgi:hypothetical protein
MSIRKIVIVVVCAALGGVIGYFGKCAGGG